MYLLLPQLVGRDQKGAEEAMAAHFATAHDWNRVLRARVRWRATQWWRPCLPA